MSTQYELSKLLKPVTDMQKDLKKGIVSESKPIREGMKHLPKAIAFPQFPSITAYDNDGEEEVDVFVGNIAEQYLRKFASASKSLSITNTILLLAPVLITVVISEVVSSRKTCSYILARAT